MRQMLRWLLFPLTLGLFLAVAYLPLPVPPYLDFQVVYHAGMGLLRGIPLYDHAGQVQMIADLTGVTPGQVILHPFPYPPWHALALLPLALLPIEVAARLWLELNIAMLMLSTFIMTEGWKPWKRLISFPLALLFLPVLGALFVGQYVFPVLLGVALLMFALRQQKPILTTLAIALLTFKPHLGVLILLVGLAHLWQRRDTFGRSALRAVAVAGAFLFGIGFLADQIWPLNYINALTEYRAIESVARCDICASAPVMVSNLIGSGGTQLPFLLAGGLLLVFVWILYRHGQDLFLSLDWLLAEFALITLLASPYLLNYDFILLLIPLFLIAGQARTWSEWILVGFTYVIPWLGLGLFGRQGNVTLVISALFLTVWLFTRTERNLLD